MDSQFTNKNISITFKVNVIKSIKSYHNKRQGKDVNSVITDKTINIEFYI